MGHTNTVDVKPKYFPSEWELSSTRASSVVRWLITHDHIAPKRLTAVGYADQRPLYGKDNPRANELNRRVEVVVQTSLPPDSAALLEGRGQGGEAEHAAPTEPPRTEEHAGTADEEHSTEEPTEGGVDYAKIDKEAEGHTAEASEAATEEEHATEAEAPAAEEAESHH